MYPAEGTTSFKGGLEAIKKLIQEIGLPVIVKETGCGFSKATLQRLHEIGVAAVEVSWFRRNPLGRIEGHRAKHDMIRQQTAQTFRNWGISTVESVLTAVELNPCFEIWGSGGVRNGLDAAKLLAFGAHSVCFAKPLLKAALDSSQKVKEVMATIEYELKVALFCTGSSVINDLRSKYVIR